MRVAVIGTGAIAARHLQVLAGEDGVEIAAHLSRNADRAAGAASQWGGQPYTDLEKLVSREHPDAAWVCVPPAAHGQIEATLVARSMPFFVEKPLAADRETAERIAELVARRGLITAVGYQLRALDVIREVRERLRRHPVRLISAAWLGTLPKPSWWRREAESGGQIVEQATHHIDLARHLVGEGAVVSAVAAQREHAQDPEADVAAVSAAFLRFGGAIPAVFTATTVLARPTVSQVQFVAEGVLVTVSRTEATYETAEGRRAVAVENDPFEAEDRAFLKAVSREGSWVYSTYEDALRTHQLCCDIVDAAREH